MYWKTFLKAEIKKKNRKSLRIFFCDFSDREKIFQIFKSPVRKISILFINNCFDLYTCESDQEKLNDVALFVE